MRIAHFAAGLGLALFGCVHTALPPFPLEWRAVDSAPMAPPEMATTLGAYRFSLEPWTDPRRDVSKVGVYEDDGYVVRTSSNVAAFCAAQFRSLFERAGGKVVAHGGNAVLRAELVEFNVVEGGLYSGDARVRFTLLIDGEVAWESVVAGSSKRWGRTHSEANFNETLSNALESVTRNLLTSAEFRGALSKRSAPSRAAPVGQPL